MNCNEFEHALDLSISLIDKIKKNEINCDEKEFLKSLENDDYRQNILSLYRKVEPEKSNFRFELSYFYLELSKTIIEGDNRILTYDLAEKLLLNEILEDRPEAWLLLGKLYFDKKHDKSKSLEYFAKAALTGNSEARIIMDSLLREKSIGKKEFFETIKISDDEIEKVKNKKI